MKEQQDTSSNRNGLAFQQPKARAAMLQPDHYKQDDTQLKMPQITLPKGGGALKSIDEKFSVNAVNGTSTLSIPLPITPGRNGFTPALSLSYNSGVGNSLFGLGWGVDFPAVQRKTDKKLPRYCDSEEEDVFMFSGVEDLVPFLDKDNNWFPLDKSIGKYRVKQYRPRIEGAFSRIERITPLNSNTFYWKVTTKDNIVTFFGKSVTHRITDPDDPLKVFKWLPEFSFDDKGNCMLYEFKDEDLKGVQNDLHERNRFSGLTKISNKHLKRVKYGNRLPYFPGYVNNATNIDEIYNTQILSTQEYFFELVFDYGEHTDNLPTGTTLWNARKDPFSDYRSGFEMRTYRLCERVLMFHHFDEFTLTYGAKTCLTKSLDLKYQHHAANSDQPLEVTYLQSATQTGYLRDKLMGTYSSRSLPPMEFLYNELKWNTEIKTISPENIVNAPTGLSNNYQWVDLYSEGISGILTEQADAWYYKSNLGGGEFSIAQKVAPKPSFTGISTGNLLLQDIEANGKKQVVVNSQNWKGYFELSDDNEWQPFRAFEQMPSLNFSDPNTKFIDLNGDGMPELVVSEENVFTWYPAKGSKGYDPAEYTSKPFDEEMGPAIVFADTTQSIFLADMSGDGLTDIVRIRNGEIGYWPNLGYGRFGAKVNMSGAPVFDLPDQFNPSYLHLADVSGTGATDILYLGKNKFKAWLNLSGNAWSNVCEINPFPTTEQPNQLAVVDLLGNGTSCIVWSSPFPAYANAPMRYIDLMGGKKPHIMRFHKNNFGKETTVEYKSSTFFYLQDKKAGTAWITKLPFPVQCVSRVETWEKITNAKFISEYTYHHGYYDHDEREFRGFGLLEQVDTENFDKWVRQDASNVVDEQLHQAPVKTKTWFHTGVFFNRDSVLKIFKNEYYTNPSLGDPLPDAVLNADLLRPRKLTPIENREALRACKGMVLRQEIYALDKSIQQDIPYSVAEHNCHIRVLQPKENNRYAVFLVSESEAITNHHERNDKDPRVAHTLNIEIDEYGNVLESASVVYKRQGRPAGIPDKVWEEQDKLHITYTQSDFTKDVIEQWAYRLRLPAQNKTYELLNYNPLKDFFRIQELKNIFNLAQPVLYEDPFKEITPAPVLTGKRLIEHVRTLYAKNNDLNQPLSIHGLESLGISFETYKLAYTKSLINDIYSSKVYGQMFIDGGYRLSDNFKTAGLFPGTDNNNEWWIPSGTVRYPADPVLHFYMPDRYMDALGKVSKVKYYSDYHLLISETEDALGNVTTAQAFDFRMLAPTLMKDANDNFTEVRFDMLGLVVGYAVKGKGHQADDFDNFAVDLSQTGIDDFFSNPKAKGANLLQHASARFVYDFDRYKNGTLPVVVASVVRGTHYQDTLNFGTDSKLQYSFEYSDGLGRVAMKKIQAEAGDAYRINPTTGQRELVRNANPRWVGTGRTVLNNKGKPVKQYEPYFSITHQYESERELVEIGVTPILFYDPVGRLIKTELPNGTFSKVEFDAWFQKNHDVNDTVTNSDWYTQRISGGKGIQEQKAAEKAALHHGTPGTVYLDSLGRSFYTIDHNKFIDKNNNQQAEFYHTRIELDTEGNQRKVIDARDNLVMKYKYDMLGAQVYQNSMDAGEKWMFNNVLGNPVLAWSSPVNRSGIVYNERFRTEYDDLHRPVKQWLAQDISLSSLEKLIGFTIYGENQTNDKVLNLRGKPFQSFDQSGRVETPEYDFKGNSKLSNKKLAIEYKQIIDWNVVNPLSLLESETFSSSSKFDALNRPIEMVMSDGSIVTPRYNEAGLLESLQAFLNRTKETHHFITNIDYDAKGQRERIVYGNNTSTSYEYDPETFRLKRLLTTRKTGQNPLQDLNYTYDPAGNIVHITNDALPTIFFNNDKVEPHGDYVYDALYRLIQATGREHAGQNAPSDQFDQDKTGQLIGQRLTLPGDMNAIQRYNQRYEYDETGNMMNMIHKAGNGIFTNRWTREFECKATNNQLFLTRVNNQVTVYGYDAHGNMLNLQNGGSVLTWNYAEQLQRVDLGGGGIAYYVYDAFGQRVRKVIENGTLIKERIYLGPYELYRDTLNLERETLHIMDDKQRIALIEHRTKGIDAGLGDLIRYQYSNHLGSAVLEIDGVTTNPQIISYEEYYPYGSTSYQAYRNQTETSKRYRYTGKERDEESGLNYHRARYCAPWLGRWCNPDPGGLIDGTNLFAYATNNPIINYDANGLTVYRFEDTIEKTAPNSIYNKIYPYWKDIPNLEGNKAPEVMQLDRGIKAFKAEPDFMPLPLSPPPLVEADVFKPKPLIPLPVRLPAPIALPEPPIQAPTPPIITKVRPEPVKKYKGEQEVLIDRVTDYVKNDFIHTTATESLPIISEVFGKAGKFLRYVPGLQGVGKAYETIGEVAGGLNLLYELVHEVNQAEAFEKGSKEVIKKTKPVKKIAEFLIKKKYPDMPEELRKKFTEGLEDLFEKYITDPAIKKLRKKAEEKDVDKDLEKSLYEQWKNKLLPSPFLK